MAKTRWAGDVVWTAAAYWLEGFGGEITLEVVPPMCGLLANKSTRFLDNPKPEYSEFQHKRKPHQWYFHPLDEETGELKVFPQGMTPDELRDNLVGIGVDIIADTQQECQELLEERVRKLINQQFAVIEQANEKIEELQQYLHKDY